MNEIQTGCSGESDSVAHIQTVRRELSKVIAELTRRSVCHDASKLLPDEKELLGRFGPLLDQCEFGTEAHECVAQQAADFFSLHYARNSHHPQHFANGIAGMDLFDLIEMMCDWIASSQRVNGTSVEVGLRYNITRFKIDEQLGSILRNTLLRWPHFTSR